MRKIKILVAPFLVAAVVANRVGIARRFHRGMKCDRIWIVLRAALVEYRCQISAPTHPPFGRDDHARVHVHCWDVWIAGVSNQRNARCPESGIAIGTRDLVAEFRRELAMNGGRVHADFFEYTTGHHAHDAAAAFGSRMIGALPRCANEPAGGEFATGSASGEIVLDLFQGCNDIVAQAFEPSARCSLVAIDGRCVNWRKGGEVRFHRHALRSWFRRVPSVNETLSLNKCRSGASAAKRRLRSFLPFALRAINGRDPNVTAALKRF